MSEQDIYTALLEIKEDIGSIKSTTADTKEALVAHISKTESLAGTVRKVELEHAKQRGAAKAYSAMGGVLGAFLGAAATYMVETFWRH